MTKLLGTPLPIPGWVAGLLEDAEPDAVKRGHIVDGQNFAALPAGQQQVRGGSRVVQTLHADADTVVADPDVGPGGSVSTTGVVALFLGAPDTTPGFHVLYWNGSTFLGGDVAYTIAGVEHTLTASAGGTALAAGTIPSDAWGLYLFSVDAAGSVTVTAAAANFTTGYASEALAIAALPATPAANAAMAYLTVKTASGQAFIGGTDSLHGGASGNVASQTNYYSSPVLGANGAVEDVLLLAPFTPLGVVAVSWSSYTSKLYAHRLTATMGFATGSESTSRIDLTAAPSSAWDNASTPGRPIAVEVFEKLYLADATLDQTARNTLLSIDSTGTVLEPQFAFAGGSAASLTPYALEEYNGVLFLAGYGDESDPDRPEYLRHSWLGVSPDDAAGFDAEAYVLVGSKGQRITALKKGRGLLLVAKEHAFWRVSGFGRAYPGWQYQIDDVQNTLGLGISNPLALTFCEGFWYGVGPQGPVRTDGFNVESLAGPRQRGWQAIDQPEMAFVSYHPERQAVLFGVHPSEARDGRSTSFPWVLWVWDLTRQVWQTDWVFGPDAGPDNGTGNFCMVTPISLTVGSTAGGSGTVSGPTAAPSLPVTSSQGTDGWTASWTVGDATAQTEYWEQETATGTWTLKATYGPTIATTGALTGRDSFTQFYWRVRHRKSGVTTAYVADTSAQTLLAPPTLTASLNGVAVQLDLTQLSDAADVIIERQVDGGAFSTWATYAAQPKGDFTKIDVHVPAGHSYGYKAHSHSAGWGPGADSADSATSTVTL